MNRVRIVLVALLLAVVSGAMAQSLRSLLPADTVAAIGVQGLSQQQAKIQPFIDEFERLGVGKAFQAAFASTEQQAEQSAKLPDLNQMPKQLQGLGLLDVLGNEAYLAVSMSQGNPLPAVVFVARVDAKAQQAASSLIAEQAKLSTVQKLTEGSITFYVETVDNGDGTTTQVAYAQDGALVALSNNPDVLRGVLRRQQGSTEPAFTDSAGYKATLGTLGDGQIVTYLALSPVATTVQPLVAAQGMDALAQRLASALDTIGTSGAVSRITAAGVESQDVRKLGPADKDPALHAMLSSNAPASTEPLGFVPSDAISVSSSSLSLSDWWTYLGGLVASAPQLGITDLNQFVQGMAGVDLQKDLFDWSGPNVATISTPAPAPQQAGMPSSDLLGASVFVLRSKDDSAAAAGLSDLFTKLATQLASFSNPTGNAAPAQAATHQVGNVTVTSYTMAPGVTLSYTVAGGHAFIATSQTALDAVLQAMQKGNGLPSTLQSMRQQVPSGAHSFTLTDAQANMKNLGASLVTGLQTFAGMGGSQNLDIAKVQAATDALQKYLDYVAGRLGGAVSYQQVSGDTITGHGMTQVRW
ncbi:MAG: hypothetical protein P8Y13_10850 [Deinococcales bacterium]